MVGVVHVTICQWTFPSNGSFVVLSDGLRFSLMVGSMMIHSDDGFILSLSFSHSAIFLETDSSVCLIPTHMT